jgi:hypothetical protein
MTYHGLYTLVSLNMQLPPSANTEQPQLFALFRNAHLNVLYKHPAGALYTLTTDEVFLCEPNIVWERIEDVDQGGPVFVDTRFERSVAVGGDRAGWTPDADLPGVGDTSECVCFRFLPSPIRLFFCSHTLARRLQVEDAEAQVELAKHAEQKQAAYARRAEQEWRKEAEAAAKKPKKKDCVIM